MGIPENIDALLVKYDITQDHLARIAKVTPGAVTGWRKGSRPRKEYVENICNYFGLVPDDIMSNSYGLANKEHGNIDDGYTNVPLLSRIAAGEPIEMEDYADSFPIPARLRDKYPDAFLLRVDGESMNRIIPNGCYALIDPCDEVLHDGKPYAVCVNGYDATIKRVHKLNNGFELVPDSNDPTYSKMTYNFNDPQTDPVTVIGEVVHYVLPYDWGF